MKERFKKMGGEGEFDVSKKTCHKFGLYHGDKIFVPYGHNKEATVIGVKKDEWGRLWIKVDGETCLKRFSIDFTIEQFEKDGGKIIKRASKTKDGEK